MSCENNYNKVNTTEGVDQMSKIAKLICLLLAMIFVVGGCRSEKAQEVATYDEASFVQQRSHYRTLHEYFYDEYEENLDEMKTDPLYPEYVRLNGIYAVGNARESDNFKAKVYLDTQTIQYGEQVIEYQEMEDQVILSKNTTDLMDETLIRMVRLAKGQEADDREQNVRLLLTAGWLPVFTLIAGLIGWFKPEWVWYVEGGFRNKEAEPAGNALRFVKVQSIIAFTLTIIFIYLLMNRWA